MEFQEMENPFTERVLEGKNDKSPCSMCRALRV